MPRARQTAVSHGLNMTLLYQSEVFLEHQTGQHPERPLRLERLHHHLQTTGLTAKCAQVQWKPASLAQLALVHDPDYIQAVDDFTRTNPGGRLEADTVVSAASFEVARLASGAACDAVSKVVQGPHRQALCLLRPPGHHALPQAAMGFCLFNHVAIAARSALREHGLERALIVDWDVHHGNGTQAVFWTDPQVGFLSVHRWPFYPGSGRAEETGSGPALGTKVNVPLAFGITRQDYLDRFRGALDALAARIRPQIILVSAGFDAHRADPIGSLGLECEDFAVLTRHVQAIANEYANGRLVSLLEGGYDPDMLARCVASHLETLLGAS